MLETVDQTLENLIKQELPVNVPGQGIQVSISFNTPRLDTIAPKPAINFCLYDVQENLDLRSTEWSIERSNGKGKRKRPPTRIDCSYLITAWPEQEEDFKTEHQLLGEVMKVLLRHRQIPSAFLPESLQGQNLAPVLVSLRPSKLQNISEFWQAMAGKEGTKPKPVLHCTVTIAVDLSAESETVNLVGITTGNSGRS